MDAGHFYRADILRVLHRITIQYLNFKNLHHWYYMRECKRVAVAKYIIECASLVTWQIPQK